MINVLPNKPNIQLLNLGEQISERQVEIRSEHYEKNGQGSFIYHGVKDIYGKNIW